MSLVALCGLAACERPPRNVLLISMDTLRADHLGAYGYPQDTSPNIDALAARGTRFAAASSTSAWTTPAHASLFASRYPSELGIGAYSESAKKPRLGEEHLTLAEVFAGKGFVTEAFTGGGFVAKELGFGQGFSTYRQSGGLAEHLESLRTFFEAERDKPFFVFLHFYDCHRPYTPPGPYATLFSGDYQGKYPIKRLCLDAPPPRTAADLAYVVSQYDGEIAYADHLLGEVFELLDDTDLDRDTVVAFTSDHGDELYDHGHCDHTHSLYEELVHVPLIIAGPGVPRGEVVEHPVSILDVAPTLLAHLKLGVPSAFRGQDLLAVARGALPPRTHHFFETEKGEIDLSGVRAGPLKLIVSRGEPAMLFDLSTDPKEQQNLLTSRPAEAAALQAAHDAWQKANAAIVDGTEISPELQRQLEALGYVK